MYSHVRGTAQRPEDAAGAESGWEVRLWVHAGIFHQGQKSNGWKVTMVSGGLTFLKAVILTVPILRRSFRCEHMTLGIGGLG